MNNPEMKIAKVQDIVSDLLSRDDLGNSIEEWAHIQLTSATETAVQSANSWLIDRLVFLLEQSRQYMDEPRSQGGLD
jgi:hypothetical protein